MPVSKQSKRKHQENEDSDSCSDFEDEIQNKYKKSPKRKESNRSLKKKESISSPKRKKALLDSDSESECDAQKSETTEDKDDKVQTSDEDIPIGKMVKKSETDGKSQLLSDTSDDEAVLNKTYSDSSESASSKSTKSDPKEKGVETSDEDKPITEILKTSKLNGKSKKVNLSSDSSDDEPLASKKSLNDSKAIKNNKNMSNLEDKGVESSDEDIPVSKMNKNSERNRKSPIISSDSSDDEALANKSYANKSKSTSPKSTKSESEERGSEISDEDAPISQMIKTPSQNGKSKINVSSDSSDNEPITTKISSNDSEITKCKESQSKEIGIETSDEDEPIAKIIKKPNQHGKLDKMETSSSDSDNEPLAAKKSVHKPSKQKSKPKKEKNNDVSSDEDEPLSKLKKTSDTKKSKSSSNDKIDHLKKYLRLAGIHIQSYDKLFADCKSVKAKTEKLLSLLHEKGLKGRPTIEKCKKLRKRIETKKEISELDMSNIIKTDGRPKRNLGVIAPKPSKIEESPAGKFSRLKDIVDSEESD